MRLPKVFTGSVLVGLALAAASSAPAQAATSCDRVASPSGSDSGAGTLESPYLTASKLAGSLAPGETGCFRAGTYSFGTLTLTTAQVTQRLATNPTDRRLQFCRSNGFFGNGNGQDFDDNPGIPRVWNSDPDARWFGPFGRWAYRNVDVRLQKDFRVTSGQEASIFFDLYNLFNFDNFNYDGFRYGLFNDLNQTTGVRRAARPFSTLDSRRSQLGVRYKF